MSEPHREAATNWFQRNPKKTLVAVTLIVILGIVYGSEKILAFINHRHGIYLEAKNNEWQLH